MKKSNKKLGIDVFPQIVLGSKIFCYQNRKSGYAFVREEFKCDKNCLDFGIYFLEKLWEI